MSVLISICIPTYNRPKLLKEAITSCFAQEYRPLELVIGDDSREDDTQKLIDSLSVPADISIRYRRNVPALGQSRNVNDLFERASGTRLLLLHDDDLLCARGLDLLVQGWKDFPQTRCIYGKQYVISAEGATLAAETKQLNEECFRTCEYVGPQASGLSAGLWQQIPNNCFLIETPLARAVGYRSEKEIGHSVDADFGIRLGKMVKPGELIYLDTFVSKYRLSQSSILRSRDGNYGHHLFFIFVEGLPTNATEALAKEKLLHRIGLGASLDAATAGERFLALKLLLSKYYDKPIFSRWTMLRLLCIATPRLGAWVRWRLHCRTQDLRES